MLGFFFFFVPVLVPDCFLLGALGFLEFDGACRVGAAGGFRGGGEPAPEPVTRRVLVLGAAAESSADVGS